MMWLLMRAVMVVVWVVGLVLIGRLFGEHGYPPIVFGSIAQIIVFQCRLWLVLQCDADATVDINAVDATVDVDITTAAVVSLRTLFLVGVIVVVVQIEGNEFGSDPVSEFLGVFRLFGGFDRYETAAYVLFVVVVTAIIVAVVRFQFMMVVVVVVVVAVVVVVIAASIAYHFSSTTTHPSAQSTHTIRMMLRIIPILHSIHIIHIIHIPHHGQQTRNTRTRRAPANVLQVLDRIARALHVLRTEHDHHPNVPVLVDAHGHADGGLEFDVGSAEESFGFLTVGPYHLGGLGDGFDDAGGEDVFGVQFEGGRGGGAAEG
mmetsp:Transcript_4530/g.8779  ORF Transcript_4530/g.8779 Transcript_4530/m.8779 type:complete len:317 (-) Transcript_4530:73-1023(-)